MFVFQNGALKITKDAKIGDTAHASSGAIGEGSVMGKPCYNLQLIKVTTPAMADGVVEGGLLARYKPGTVFIAGAKGIIFGKLRDALDELPITLNDFLGKSRCINDQSASLTFDFAGLGQKGQQYMDEACVVNASDPNKVNLLKGVLLDQYTRGKPVKVLFSNDLETLNKTLAEKKFLFSLTDEQLTILESNKKNGMPTHIDVVGSDGETYALERSTKKKGALNIFKRANAVPSSEEYDEYLNKVFHMTGYLTARKLCLIEQEFGSQSGFSVANGAALVNTQVTLVQIAVWNAIKEILPDIIKNIDFAAVHKKNKQSGTNSTSPSESTELSASASDSLTSSLGTIGDYSRSLTEGNTRKEYDSMTSKGAYDRLKATFEIVFGNFASFAPQLAKTVQDAFTGSVVANLQTLGTIDDMKKNSEFTYDIARKKKQEKDDQDGKTDGGFA